MTVQSATKVATEVRQLRPYGLKTGENEDKSNEKGKWSEDAADLDYPVDVNEEQTIADPDGGENSENRAPGFQSVSTVPTKQVPSSTTTEPAKQAPENVNTQELRPFSLEETIFIFDWDDTILPSAWVQQQGLRLDEDSKISESQQQQLDEVAKNAIETIRIAKQHGTVVFVTNAERGWIELSCQKFMPSLYPALESIKLLSARTTYESASASSPLDWKLCAFESEIRRIYGDDVVSEPSRRKNVLSLGDSMHEREALLRATASLPNCRSKSLKFVERPDIGQICKQHTLITGCFDRIVQHDGNLDLCIRCA